MLPIEALATAGLQLSSMEVLATDHAVASRQLLHRAKAVRAQPAVLGLVSLII
jgi:hypothetical protein